MKKAFITLALTFFLLNTSGYVLSEEMAKEGSYTGKNYATGTSKARPMGEACVHVSSEGSGI